VGRARDIPYILVLAEVKQKPDKQKPDKPNEGLTPLALPSVSRYFPPAVAKTYVVTFRSHNDDRPSKFIVVADNMKSAIKMALGAWRGGLPIAVR